MKTRRFLKRHSPLILTVIGSVGVVGTAVLAVSETPKAMRLLQQAEEEKGELLSKTEMVLTAGPTYVPAIVMGVSTIFCFASALMCSKRQQASMLSAYELSRNAFKEYRKTLIDLYGEDTDRAVYDAMMVRTNGDFHLIEIEKPDVKTKFYEPITGKIFEAYEREIMDAEYHLNRNYTLRGYVSVNEYLTILGFDEIDDGGGIGWDCSSGFYWIDFEHRKTIDERSGEILYRIDTVLPPEVLEEELI